MNNSDIRTAVLEELGGIAPEADFDALDPKADMRDALDIDSMDILNFVTAIHHRLGIDVPERDYPKLVTLAGAIEYLEKARAKLRV